MALGWMPAGATRPLFAAWRRHFWSRRAVAIRRKNQEVAHTLVASGRPIQLELASSTRPGRTDWTFSDIHGNGDLQLDLTEALPFPDDSVERIYSSHLLEHFSYPHPMLDLLGECHRVLRKGGEFSIAVPNARIFLEAYALRKELPANTYFGCEVGLTFETKIDYVNFIAYLGDEHKHMFDEENMVAILARAGFREARIRPFDAQLDLESRRHESLYASCIK